MNKETPYEIEVLDGNLAGHRFSVTKAGLRMGRSSSCEISIKDPSLSRNHVLFELRDDGLWVTDLASVNGTSVNNEDLGDTSRKLALDDIIFAGNTHIKVVVAHTGEGEGASNEVSRKEVPVVDLGLESSRHASSPADEDKREKIGFARILLWILAVVAVGFAAWTILSAPIESENAATFRPASNDATIRSFFYEKVEATGSGIFRYASSWDKDGELRVEIDDVPTENRHVRKAVKLSADAQKRLMGLLDMADLYRLDSSYSGTALTGEEHSKRLRVIRGESVFDVVVSNTLEPEPIKEIAERLETFAKNEMGLWSVQYSAEKLTQMSEELLRVADAKWAERDVQQGNLAAALAAYDEAVLNLETVDPKPAFFADLATRRDAAKAELDRRYREQRFAADRAINLGDWETAKRELSILREMIPNAQDERNVEATAKLLDVESRLGKGAKK